jgi:hypothetical protein
MKTRYHSFSVFVGFLFLFTFLFTSSPSTSFALTADVVARTGQNAFGISGSVYNGLFNDNTSPPTAPVALPAPKFAGELVAFFSSLRQGTTAPLTDNGLWLLNQTGTSGRKIIRAGESATEVGPDIIHSQIVSNTKTSPDGRISFFSSLSGPNVTFGLNSAALWLANTNENSLIIRSTEPAPETVPPGYFRTIIESYHFNGTSGGSDTGFRAMVSNLPGQPQTLSNTYGVWARDENENLRKLTWGFGAVPGISNAYFETSGEFVSESGQAVHVASMYGSAVTTIVAGEHSILTDKVLFHTDIEGGYTLLARTGYQAPGVPEGVVFRTLPSALTNSGNAPAIGSDGTIVFWGMLAGVGINSGNQEGLWKYPGQGTPTVLTRIGNPATAVGPGVVFVSLQVSSAHETLRIMDNGDTVFVPALDGQGVTLGNFTAIYKITANHTHQLIARAGVANTALPTGTTLVRAMLPQVLRATGNDHVMFTSQLAGSGVTTDNNSVLMRHTNANGLQLVARKGQQIGDFILKSFVNDGADLQLTDNYYAVVSATFSPASNPTATAQPGILGISPDGTPSVLAVRNSPIQLSDSTTPTVLNFRLAPESAISPSGKVVFSAQFSTTPRDEAVLVSQISGNTTPSCPVDFNNNGTADVPDIFAFLSAWFAQSSNADFNENGTIAVDDIFAFLSAWFAGC